MNRTAALLVGLLAVALVALSFMFLIKPKMDEVTELEAEAETLRSQQAQVQSQISALQQVRATSPNLEAELAAIGAIIPTTPSLPAALRQLQVAADDSGVTLVSVAPGRPSSADVGDIPELSTISVSLALEGGYFQVVDFLRRIEDPRLTARGFLLSGVSASPAEYPTLNVTVTGAMFALLDQPVTAQPEPEPTETATDADVEVDVDVEVTEEDAA